jgi:hypothetical protein
MCKRFALISMAVLYLALVASASNCSNFQGLDACVGNQTE